MPRHQLIGSAAVAILLLSSIAAIVFEPPAGGAGIAACPGGTVSFAEFERHEARMRSAGVVDDESAMDQLRSVDLIIRMEQASRGAGLDAPGLCVPARTPESYAELMAAANVFAAPRLAGMGGNAEGAYPAAVEQRRAMAAGETPGTSGIGQQYGLGPLDSTQFGTATLGIDNSAGRIDDFSYDADADRLFAAIGNAGIWMSADRGANWTEVNGDLPITSVGSVEWTPAGGGRLVVITGDGSYGGIAGQPGVGAYWTDDIGLPNDQIEWHRAEGVPGDTLGFRVAVDQDTPANVYVATSKGLYRSTNAASTFVNVALPTGACAGISDTRMHPECHLANVVTDVVVQSPGGTTGVTAPVVVAAVGWRGGNFENPDGTVQSPSNGIYRSTDGGVSFSRAAETGFTAQDRIGRIELGSATGAAQDHGWLFAMVQDAAALNHIGCALLDAPLGCNEPIIDAAGLPVGAINTVIDGVYASSDFGDTWVQIASTESFQNPASGSALNGLYTAIGYQPGVQAWYNQFVAPDPTTADPVTGAPTRLLIGLEEVWENTDTLTPTDVPPLIPPVHPGTLFRVVGRYFGGETCQGLDVESVTGIPIPVCPTNTQDPTLGGDTTHPDQQSAIWIDNGDGSVDLFVGNDGGAFRQVVESGTDVQNTGWGPGVNTGFQTLMPYFASAARDGRVWFGLQDNGSGFIDPTQDHTQFQTFGGDGHFTAVDPDDSDIAYHETPGAGMSVTTDGGASSAGIDPPADGGPYRFSNPFAMDPGNALNLVTGGRKIYASDVGPATTTDGATGWQEVADLGMASDDLANQMSAIDVVGNNMYVGFCGSCDILNAAEPFQNGIATNVAGGASPYLTSPQGWHVAEASGLPNRFITSVAIDPENPQTVVVTLGGYSRKWFGPGAAHDSNDNVGEGHVFRSTDAGETFVDWSGNLPDVTTTWVELRGDQLLVGTDVGAFASRFDGAAEYSPLEDVPNTPIGSIQLVPGNPNRAIIATFGRGVWSYDFEQKLELRTFQRLAGRDRVQTAVAVSQQQFTQADTVVLATASNYADALAAVPLAASKGAPILLTSSDRLRPEVAAEIQRLGADRVIIVGGTAAITSAVSSEIVAIGGTVERVAGSNRFETAAAVAREVPTATQAYVVEGVNGDPRRGWPDALAVGPLAAASGDIVLLTSQGSLPTATGDVLAELGITDVTVVGGTAAVADEVVAELEAGGASVARVAGADRYATSAALADKMVLENLTDQRVWISRGTNWPDALAAGAAVAANGGVLLLVPATDLSASHEILTWLGEHGTHIEHVYVLGGSAAVPESIVDQVREALLSGPPPEPEAPPLTGETLASYTFDVDGEGWVASGTGPGQFMLRPPGDNSTQAWRVEPYLPDTSPSITSPSIDQPGGRMKLDWTMAFNTEEGFDYVTVDWFGPDGASGTLFGGSGANANYPQFDAYTAEFIAPPGPITFRFRLYSDQLVTQVGAAVDNVTIQR